jgi:ABC-type branched-subunit amino acid transport system substrate-binding protein/serine/threonine protein kinase
MEIHCTRTGCANPTNQFPDLDDSTLLKTVPQRYCQECGMPLILDSRYVPIKLLRKGGFGTVFLAYDRRTPRLKRCIIKQLQFNPQFNDEQIATATILFYREAEVLETLGEHPRIPRFFAFLELESPPAKEPYVSQKFCYLVQDYIEGQDLQQELRQKDRLSITEVQEVLQQILEILEFIHHKGVIHRDIKPSNIVRDPDGKVHLIDFGAVKQIISTATTLPHPTVDSLTGICTPEYAPMEQRQCSAIYPSSDLYALGVTCLHLLSGEHPPNLFDYHSHSWQWEQVPISPTDSLRPVLERMLQETPLYRFPSASAVLTALSKPVNQATNLTEDTVLATDTVPQKLKHKFHFQRRHWIGSGLAIGALALGGLLAVNLMRPPIASSSGQRILLLSGTTDAQRFNQAGVAAMAKRNYPEAIRQFRAALQKQANSPETRIYLNNALVGNQPSYTIAVSVPITEESNYRALEMLRGFAHAQEQINGEKKIKVKLEIFNDEDRPEKAEGIAKALVHRPDILAVVGHNSSAVSLAAAKIYNSNQLPFIAPVSTTISLTGAERPYIFRTNVRSDSVSQRLASYMLHTTKKRRAAIFYVPDVPYSKDLTVQFSNQLSTRGGSVVGNFDLTSANSSTSGALLRQAVSKGAEVIVLFPTRKYRKNALSVLRHKHRNYRNLAVFGDIATLYNFETLEEAGEAAQGMVLGVSWRAGESKTTFTKESYRMWNARTNWATATSYDAIKALGVAISSNKQPSRQTVKDNLSNLEFQGAAGKFQFFGGESESQDTVTMLQVKKTPPNYLYGSGTGQDFMPVSPQLK